MRITHLFLIFALFLVCFLMSPQAGFAAALTKADDIPAGLKLGLDVAQAIADQQNVQNGLSEFAKGQLDDWMWNSIGGYEKLWTGQLDDVDAISKQAKDKIKKSLEILQQITDFATKVGEGKYDEALFVTIDAAVSHFDHPVVKTAWAACKLAYESHKLVQDTKAELEIEALYGMLNNDRRLIGTITPGQDQPRLIPENTETVDYFFNKYLMTNDQARNLMKTYVRKVLGDEWPEQSWGQWLSSWQEIGSGADSARSAEIEALATELRNKARTWIMLLIKDLNKQVKVAWAQARVRQEMAEFQKFVERMRAFSGNIDELFREFKQKAQYRKELPKYREFLAQSPQALEKVRSDLADTKKLRQVREIIELWEGNLTYSYSAARLIGEETLSRSLQEQLKKWYELEKEYEKSLPSYNEQLVQNPSSIFYRPLSEYPFEYQSELQSIVTDAQSIYRTHFASILKPFDAWQPDDINQLKSKVISLLKSGNFDSASNLIEEWRKQNEKIEKYYSDMEINLHRALEPNVQKRREIEEARKEKEKLGIYTPEEKKKDDNEIAKLAIAAGFALDVFKEMKLVTYETVTSGNHDLWAIYSAYEGLKRTRQSQWGQYYAIIQEMIKSLPIKAVTGKLPDSDLFYGTYSGDPSQCSEDLDSFLNYAKQDAHTKIGTIIRPDEKISDLDARMKSLRNSILSGIKNPEHLIQTCNKWIPVWREAANKWEQFPKVSQREMEEIEIFVKPVVGSFYQGVPLDFSKIREVLTLIENTAKSIPGLISKIDRDIKTLVQALDTDTLNRQKDGEWLLEKARQVDAFFKDQIAKGIFKIGYDDYEIAFTLGHENMAIMDTPYWHYATEKDFEEYAKILEDKWNKYPVMSFIKQYAPGQYQKMLRLARGEGIKKAPEENFIPIFSQGQPIYKSGLMQANLLLDKSATQLTDNEFDRVMNEINTLIPNTVFKDDKALIGWGIVAERGRDIMDHSQYFQHPLGEQYVNIYNKIKKFFIERSLYKSEEIAKKAREQIDEQLRKAQEEAMRKQEEQTRQQEQERLAMLTRELSTINELYARFKSAYESRNDSLVMSFLGDSWSAGDGTTLADLHENLRRTFKTYNEIRFNLQNLQIYNVGPQKYQVSYDVTITSRIYSLDIKHEEKSSVVEEVTLESPNKPKISRTISGRFWYIE